MIKNLDKEDFNELISKGYWLVDFYADWCGPCKMMGEILKDIDSIDIIKVNVDAHQDIAQKYGVMSIPTLVFIKDGSSIHKEIGFVPQDEIEAKIKEIKK